MARRVLRPVDSARTEQLAMDELFVVKGEGNTDHYVAWLYNYDEFPKECPACGGNRMMIHNRFSRTYTDYIMEEGVPRVINLDYQFYKYRCLNSSCGRIFSAEIKYATVNDHVTHRLEDKIAELVIAGFSYEEISLFFQRQISRQGIGQIFNRWVQVRNDRRRLINPPSIIGVFTGKTDDEQLYSLVVSCDDGICLLDILLGTDYARIVASLRRFSMNMSQCVLTDCNPTVYAAAKEALPQAVHIIPAEMWLKLVREDFIMLSHDDMRWALPSIRNKRELILAPKAEDEENLSLNLRRIFDARPQLKEPYMDYHYLRDRITDHVFRWNISELDEWAAGLDDRFRKQLDATLLQYNLYREEIAHQQDHWEFVPESLLSSTDRLAELILAKRTFSEEALQAAVLYSIETDLENWQGIKIEDSIVKLSDLQNSRRSNYEYE